MTIESRSFSATGTRAAPGRSTPVGISPGGPPGRGSFESFSPRTSFSRPASPAESFKSVKPATSLKLENKLAPAGSDQKFTPQVRSNFNRPLTPEKIGKFRTSAEVKPNNSFSNPQKGSERFISNFAKFEPKKIGEVAKTKPNSFETVKLINITKTEAPKTRVPDAFYKAFSETPPARTQVPDTFYRSFNEKPPVSAKTEPGSKPVEAKIAPKTENYLKNFQKIEPNRLAELPNSKANSFESVKIANLTKNEALKAPKTEIHPEVKRSLEAKKPDELTKLVKEARITKPEVLSKAKLAENKKAVKDILRKDLVSSADKKSLSKAVETFIKPKIEAKSTEINAVRPLSLALSHEGRGNRLNNPTDMPITPASPAQRGEPALSLREGETSKAQKSSAIAEKNVAQIRQVLSENSVKPTEKVVTKLADQITEQTKVMDTKQAREMVAKTNTEDGKLAKPEVKTASDVTKLTEKLNIEAKKTEKAAPTVEQQTQVKSLTEALKNPDIKIKIAPEERAQALETVKLMTETKEYQLNPTLHQQTKELVKEVERQIVEEQQLVETVTAMREAGMETDQIMPIITAQVEAKSLPLEATHIDDILLKVEQKVNINSELVDVEKIEEQQLTVDERKRLLIEIKMLFVELDEKALAERFSTIFEAIHKAYKKALEEGREYFTGADIYAEHPQIEEEEEKSEMIQGKDRGDGGHRIALEAINNASIKFVTLDHAYDFVTKVLMTHRPGRIREVITTTDITPEEKRMIWEDRPMATANYQNSQLASFVSLTTN